MLGLLTLEKACASLYSAVVFHCTKHDIPCRTVPNDTLISTA